MRSFRLEDEDEPPADPRTCRAATAPALPPFEVEARAVRATGRLRAGVCKGAGRPRPGRTPALRRHGASAPDWYRATNPERMIQTQRMVRAEVPDLCKPSPKKAKPSPPDADDDVHSPELRAAHAAQKGLCANPDCKLARFDVRFELDESSFDPVRKEMVCGSCYTARRRGGEIALPPREYTFSGPELQRLAASALAATAFRVPCTEREPGDDKTTTRRARSGSYPRTRHLPSGRADDRATSSCP